MTLRKEKAEPGDRLASDDGSRREKSVVLKERQPGQRGSRDRLGKAHTRHAGNKAAAFQKREHRIHLKREDCSQHHENPGQLPGHRTRGLPVRGEKVESRDDQYDSHQYSRHRVPPHRFLQDRRQTRMRRLVAGDFTARADLELCTLVRGQLQHDE